MNADWCRAINPFQFTKATKKTVTNNIICLIRNYLLSDDIETVIFHYGFYGERKALYDEVMNCLRNEGIIFDEYIVAYPLSLRHVLTVEYQYHLKIFR